MPKQKKESGLMSRLAKRDAKVIPDSAEIHSLTEAVQNMNVDDHAKTEHEKQIIRDNSLKYIEAHMAKPGEKRPSGASTQAESELGDDELDFPLHNNSKKPTRAARPSLMKTIADIISPTKKMPLASVAIAPSLVPSTLYLTNVAKEPDLHQKFLQLTGLAKKSNDIALNELDKLGNLCIKMLLHDKIDITEKVLGSPELGAFIFYLLDHPEIICLDLTQIQMPAWNARTKGMTRAAEKARERRDQFVSDLNQCLELMLTYATNIQTIRVPDFSSIQKNEEVEHRLAFNRQISHDLNVLENNTGTMLLPKEKIIQALDIFKERQWLEKLIDVPFCQEEAPEACRIMKERKLDLIAQLENYYHHEAQQKTHTSGKILMKQLQSEWVIDAPLDAKTAKKHQSFLYKIDRAIESSIIIIRAQRMSRQFIEYDQKHVSSVPNTK